jgi:N-succinyldiaminopimelate aminotransferase
MNPRLELLQPYPLPGHRRAPALREAIAGWLQRRYGLRSIRRPQVLPVQRLARGAVRHRADGGRPLAPRRHRGLPQSRSIRSTKGAALLAGAQTGLCQQRPGAQLRGRLGGIDDATWARTQLRLRLLARQPHRRGDAAVGVAALFALSDRHGFVIASDECYSEIYFRDEPPLGGPAGRGGLGRSDFRRLIAFTSLSKRSNVPGCARASWPAMPRSSRPSCSTAPTTAAR